MKFGPKYEGLCQDWEIAVAKNVVGIVRVSNTYLKREGFDDLLQECLTHWFLVRKSYNPEREASPETFMARVLRNKLTDIARELQADKRKVAHLSVSLVAPLEGEEDSPTLIDKIESDTIRNSSFETVVNIDLKIDITTVLKKLSTEDQELCHALRECNFNIKQASEYLNTPRSTIYDELKRIRKIFLKEALQDYLK